MTNMDIENKTTETTNDSIAENATANERTKSFYENSGSAKLDTSIDLNSLIHNAKSDTNLNKENTTTVSKPLSPLEQLKKQQESGEAFGAVFTDEELKKGKEVTEFKNNVYNDDRMNAIEERISELDSTFEKRKLIVPIQFPEIDSKEFTDMIIEIDSLTKKEDGSYYFNLKDASGNLVEPKYVRLRLPDEPPYTSASEDMKLAKGIKEPKKEEDKETPTEDVVENISDKKKEIVQILIDKTGLGINYDFSQEEKEKMYNSQEIRLTEVEFLDIESITMATPTEKSFQETVEEFDFCNSKTTICFPASGFRAQMKGMTYGEMADVSLSMDSVTFDQYYKRLSVIYNKMINISTGPFASFEDFLRGFSYLDIPMALYGLYISTQPEIQQIQLKCGSDNCGKYFDWKFNTRSVLQLDQCSDTFLSKMDEIASANPSDYDRIRKESSVKQSKFIRLPFSKLILEMGPISCYEFLYNFITVLNPETFKDNFGDDPSGIYGQNVLFLSTIRSIRVPFGNEYVLYTNYKDILDALYDISPEEVRIIASLSEKIMDEYQCTFGFNDVECPHCGSKTKFVEVSMDQLVFQTYRLLMNTGINVENMRLS